MQNCRREFTPLPRGLVLNAETGTPPVDPTLYCRAVGKLIFLTHTRPDISHAIGIVSRFMQHPQQAHWDVVSHILRYISTTSDFGILYSRSGLPSLTGYTDADYLSCSSTRRSIGAYIFKLASGPISWSSKQQPTVSDSTIEAKYKALSEGAKEAVYIRRLFLELGIVPARPVPLTIRFTLPFAMHIFLQSWTYICIVIIRVQFDLPRTQSSMQKSSTLRANITSYANEC